MADPVTSLVDGGGRARPRVALLGLIVFALVLAFAFLGPPVWTWDHLPHPDIPRLAPPSVEHPFGTTAAGHDVLAQVMRGTRESLKVALTAAALSTVIGSIWGAIAGFYRGWIDTLMMRVVDLVLVIPFLAVAASLSGAGVTWFHLAVILGLAGWTGTARAVRARVLSVREQEYIEAARAVGASDARIILRHLAPNTTGVVVAATTVGVATAILAETALSFVGLGLRPPDASLGLLIGSAALTRPWLFYFPGVFIIVICLTVTVTGLALRRPPVPR